VPRVVGVQIGKATDWKFGTRRVLSAIGKMPVQGTVSILELGLAGDEQVNLRYHGGPERALCAYPASHLEAWEREWEVSLPPGSFGENLTVVGLDETSTCIGDRFRFGTALLEVTQPREPCGNLASRLGVPGALERIRGTSRTGWYLRVLVTGEASANMSLERESEGASRVTVAEAYRIRTDGGASEFDLRRLIEAPGLSAGWRAALGRRLNRSEQGMFLL
jgi:MOSC domain-containing protein YiiM